MKAMPFITFAVLAAFALPTQAQLYPLRDGQSRVGNYLYVWSFQKVNVASEVRIDAPCPGYVLLGGGYEQNSSGLDVYVSKPSATLGAWGWEVAVVKTGDDNKPIGITVYATCGPSSK